MREFRKLIPVPLQPFSKMLKYTAHMLKDIKLIGFTLIISKSKYHNLKTLFSLPQQYRILFKPLNLSSLNKVETIFRKMQKKI